MARELWTWLTVADEHIKCSSALFSISFTLNILLSAIPSARKNFFRIVRSWVHGAVVAAVNADTLANIDDNSRALYFFGKIFKWLISPFYKKESSRVRWMEVLVTFVMAGLAAASAVLIARENNSRLGLLFCIPFPLYFMLYALALGLRWLLIIALAWAIRKCCAKKEKPQREKSSKVFAEIAAMTGTAGAAQQMAPAALRAPRAAGVKSPHSRRIPENWRH